MTHSVNLTAAVTLFQQTMLVGSPSRWRTSSSYFGCTHCPLETLDFLAWKWQVVQTSLMPLFLHSSIDRKFQLAITLNILQSSFYFFKYTTSNFRKQMVTFPKNSLTTSLIHWSGYTIFYCSLSKYLARKRDVSFLFVKIPPSLKQLCLKWGRNNSGENNLSPEIIVIIL